MLNPDAPSAPNLDPERGRRRTAPRGPFAWIADDDEEMRALVASRLRTYGLTVTEFASGSEMAETFSAIFDDPNAPEPPDLIVSDYRMPGLDGMELFRLVRETDGVTPFILMTAFGAPELYEEAERLGIAAVLDKPFDPRLLEGIVRVLN